MLDRRSKSLIDRLADMELGETESAGRTTADLTKNELWDPGELSIYSTANESSAPGTINELLGGIRANDVKIMCRAGNGDMETLSTMQSSIEHTSTFSMLQRVMGASKESYINTMLLMAMASTPENSLPTNRASRERLRHFHISLQTMVKEDRQLLSDVAIEQIRRIQTMILLCG